MKNKVTSFLSVVLAVLFTVLTGCVKTPKALSKNWVAGFASEEIKIPENTDYPLYIAGYKNGCEIDDVLDNQQATAVWLSTSDSNGMLFISVDCIALSSETVNEIRSSLSDFCKDTGCVSINVFSTHDHAGIDTLGLWGKKGFDGKNPRFMDNLKKSAVTAAKKAYKNRKSGTFTYGDIDTDNLQNDSRYPYIYSKTLHQFRFQPDDTKEGIRIIIYSAHAESLGSDNRLVSRDYPGVLCDKIKESTNDDTIFINGAIGGLIATSKQCSAEENAINNMKLTGEKLADYALKIKKETKLLPVLNASSINFSVPLDNPLYMYYRFLGILGNKCVNGISDTGYCVKTSLTVITLGNKTLLCLPCEIFPELVSGESLKANDPVPLAEIAHEYGLNDLIVAGLCNDEIGYVVPPSVFLTDEKLPFVKNSYDFSGESHYEETNSVGKNSAQSIANAFEKVLSKNNKKR